MHSMDSCSIQYLVFYLRRLPLLLTLPFLTACEAFKPVNILNAIVPASGYTLEEGVAYGVGERQKMDIYFPDTPATVPRTIVFVYGGAWREGNRSEYEFVGQALAEAGHTVVIPDYRLYPSVVFPDFVEDVVDAMVGAKAFLEKHGGNDLAEVVLMGHSSGAHTVAMIASDTRWLEGSGVTPSALVAISGPYDLPLENPEVAPVFKGVKDTDSVRPVARVTAVHPPALLIHGDEDERVLPFHTRNYAAALAEAGISFEVQWLEGAGHVSAIAGLAAPLDSDDRNRRRITMFLDGL